MFKAVGKSKAHFDYLAITESNKDEDWLVYKLPVCLHF